MSNMKDITRFFGFGIIKKDYYHSLLESKNSNHPEFFQLLHHFDINKEAYECYKISQSQFLQDVFVLIYLNFIKDGYFVEFGSSDGISASNTFILEKHYNWKGILVEPSRGFRKDLVENRDSIIDYRCVYHESGSSVKFNETTNGYLSTIDKYSDGDQWKKHRVKGQKYKVETVTLEDLLDEYNAPKVIEYLSIDTEGSEYDILQCFNFNKYAFKIITVEHNFILNSREKINRLLEFNGYKRILEEVSKVDDWYINTRFEH